MKRALVLFVLMCCLGIVVNGCAATNQQAVAMDNMIGKESVANTKAACTAADKQADKLQGDLDDLTDKAKDSAKAADLKLADYQVAKDITSSRYNANYPAIELEWQRLYSEATRLDKQRLLTEAKLAEAIKARDRVCE
ncbi:hypothetical protein HY933_04685 [Candidatus Falkowbacteria bacterium]|nr:hypothetical protein [Candidatus Falkowbacteria bacterium]